jgi:thymidylate kinase
MLAFEGPSCSGKSTVMKELKIRHQDWVYVDGYDMSAIGLGETWFESWQHEHRWKLPIYRDNPEVTFVVNRPFSEAIYAYTEERRYECRRMASCYEGIAKVVYFDAPDSVLEDRGAADPLPRQTVRDRYDELETVLPFERFNTARPIQSIADDVEELG